MVEPRNVGANHNLGWEMINAGARYLLRGLDVARRSWHSIAEQMLQAYSASRGLGLTSNHDLDGPLLRLTRFHY